MYAYDTKFVFRFCIHEDAIKIYSVKIIMPVFYVYKFTPMTPPAWTCLFLLIWELRLSACNPALGIISDHTGLRMRLIKASILSSALIPESSRISLTEMLMGWRGVKRYIKRACSLWL